MFDVGADVFAECGIVPDDVVSLSVFFFYSSWLLVRTVECIGIHWHRVLFGMVGRLGRRRLDRMIDGSGAC